MLHSEDHSTERPGERLKRARVRLKLTYRDVELASQKIAARRHNPAFAIALSRLADIENKGTLPSLFRAYTLSAIYRLDFDEVLRWYGIPLGALAGDALHVQHGETHTVQIAPGDSARPAAESAAERRLTSFLGTSAKAAGSLPLQLLEGFDVRRHRYGFIGTEDWSMYPILHPGSLILIDDRRRKIIPDGWSNEHERPIYFLEHRSGFFCGWCNIEDQHLILQTHPASRQRPRVFGLPEIDVVGQVVGVAMILAGGNDRPGRAASTPAPSPGL